MVTMNDVHKEPKRSIESRINEAELYRSMGLLDESLSMYKSILPGLSEDDSGHAGIVKERIGLLKDAVKGRQKRYTRTMSGEDMSTIRQVLATGSSSSQILNSANAFKELGLVEEAAAEYEILFEYDFPHEEVIPAFLEVLLVNRTIPPRMSSTNL
jgi:hypothetical protein